MAVSACIESFILVILCGNPILKGAFSTFLNTLILQLDEEIAVLTLQLGRLNFLNQFLSLELQTVQALVDKVSADFNLILDPLKQFGDCPELAQLSNFIQDNAVNKNIAGLQNKLYELNRVTNLVNLQNAIIKQKDQLRNSLQEFVDRIGTICP